MRFVKSDTPLLELRASLYKTLTAPIDAMWELLYIAMADDYIIEDSEQIIGYCSIDTSKALLQLYLKDDDVSKAKTVVLNLVAQQMILEAKLSSATPIAFNACLELSTSLNTNTYCFEHSQTQQPIRAGHPVVLAGTEDIPAAQQFLNEQVGLEDTFGYTENLVARRELFLMKESGAIIALSECRLSDTQPDIADLGIIVHTDQQGQGLATQVLRLQANRVMELGRRPICSTTVDNIASQKAIERSGFYCTNTIFDMTFNP